MFQTLIASSPQTPPSASRHLLSLSFHGVVVAGAVALTRHPPTAAHSPPPDPALFFVATQAIRRPLPPPGHGFPNRSAPTPPRWRAEMEAPDLTPPALSATVPTVANLLEAANLRSGARPGLPGFGPDDATGATLEPLTAASVDDPVGVVEQPAPRYPPALERAGITGHVELEYVVDTTGRVEPGSLRTLVTTHPAFEAAAQVTVLASRYRPARLGGRVVRQLVRQTLRFRVEQ
jgi:TonB family protein